jgi:hypothetical protein
MATGAAHRGCLRNLGRILICILIISAVLLVGGTIYVGTVTLTNPTAAYERRLPLPSQHSLELSIRPACTWDMPAIVACYHGGVRTHPEVSLVYATPTARHVLVSFALPWG